MVFKKCTVAYSWTSVKGYPFREVGWAAKHCWHMCWGYAHIKRFRHISNLKASGNSMNVTAGVTLNDAGEESRRDTTYRAYNINDGC